MMQLGEHEGPVYLRTSPTFPVVDFVASSRHSQPRTSQGGIDCDGDEVVVQEWWNAKTGSHRPEVSSMAFMRVMHGLELIDNHGAWIDERKQVKIKLRFVCSGRAQAHAFVDRHSSRRTDGIGSFARAMELFDRCVDVECVNAMDWKGEWLTWRLEMLDLSLIHI